MSDDLEERIDTETLDRWQTQAASGGVFIAAVVDELIIEVRTLRDALSTAREALTKSDALLREAMTLAAGMPDATFEEWRNWIARAQRQALNPLSTDETP